MENSTKITLEDVEEKVVSKSQSDTNSASTLNGVVEISPYRRYIRFDDINGQNGILGTTFRAFDTINAIEVNWHIICFSDLVLAEGERVTKSANVLKKIQNKYIVEYLTCWIASESNRFNIITSHLPSLKDFLGKRGMTLRWKVVKKWCTRILRGLEYLHTSSPRIVHRNLTCSHIYINSSTGDVYIGDTWLAEILTDSGEMVNRLIAPESKYSQLCSMPAYLAPELFDKSPLTTLADIYSFGMCVLEIITREEPYKECTGIATAAGTGTGSGSGGTPSPMAVGRIAYRAKQGVLPRAMSRVPHPAARDFILECLKDSAHRPSASDLLLHPFLSSAEFEIEEIALKGYDQDSSTQISDDMDEETAAAEEEAALLFESKLSFRNSRRSASSDSDSGGESSSSSSQGDEGGGGGSTVLEESDVFNVDTVVAMNQGGGGGGGGGGSLRDRLDLISFDEGEDIRHDKGVQDGRVVQESEDSMETVLPVLPQAPTLFSPARKKGSPASQAKRSTEKLSSTPRSRSRASSRSDSNLSIHGNNSAAAPSLGQGGMPRGSLSSISLADHSSSSSSSSAVSNDRVEVKLQIPKGHSKDGQFKEVEFTFNVLRDRYEVVASEMIDELELSVSIEELAKKIEDQVRRKERAVGDTSEPPMINKDSNRNTTTTTTTAAATEAVPDGVRGVLGAATGVATGRDVVTPETVPGDAAVGEGGAPVGAASTSHDRSLNPKATRESSLPGPLHFPLMSSDVSPEGSPSSSSSSSTVLSSRIAEVASTTTTTMPTTQPFDECVVDKEEVEVVVEEDRAGTIGEEGNGLGSLETSFTNDNSIDSPHADANSSLESSPVSKHRAMVAGAGAVVEVAQVNNLSREGGAATGNTELMKKQSSKETLRDLFAEPPAAAAAAAALTSWGGPLRTPLASAIAITAMEVSDEDATRNTRTNTNATTLPDPTMLSVSNSNGFISPPIPVAGTVAEGGLDSLDLPASQMTPTEIVPTAATIPLVVPPPPISIPSPCDVDHMDVSDANADAVSTMETSNGNSALTLDGPTESPLAVTATATATVTAALAAITDPLGMSGRGSAGSEEYTTATATATATVGSWPPVALPAVTEEISRPPPVPASSLSTGAVTVGGQLPAAVDTAAVETAGVDVVESETSHSQSGSFLSRTNTPTATSLEPYLSLSASLSAEESRILSANSAYSSFTSGSEVEVTQRIILDTTTSPQKSVVAVTTSDPITVTVGSNRDRDRDTAATTAAAATDMDAAEEEAEEAAALQVRRERERIDKDSRAARRAFEQRIQKHKIIQEACDEDIFKNENEYVSKVSELRKKEDGCIRRREDELTKIYEDFELKKMRYLERRREEVRRRRLSVESTDNDSSTTTTLSPGLSNSNISSSNSINTSNNNNSNINNNNNNSNNSQQHILPQKSYLAAAIGSHTTTASIFHSSPSSGVSLSHPQSLSAGVSLSTVSASPSSLPGGAAPSLSHLPPHPATASSTTAHMTPTSAGFWSLGLGTPAQSTPVPPSPQPAQPQAMTAWNLTNSNNGNSNSNSNINNNSGNLAGGGSVSSSSINTNNLNTSNPASSNDAANTANNNNNNNNNNFSSSFGGIHQSSHSSSSPFLPPLSLSSSLSSNS